MKKLKGKIKKYYFIVINICKQKIIRQKRKRKELKYKQKEFAEEIRKTQKKKAPTILQNPDLVFCY